MMDNDGIRVAMVMFGLFIDTTAAFCMLLGRLFKDGTRVATDLDILYGWHSEDGTRVATVVLHD